MAKFIDKKQQVLDFQLTPYGKYKLSLGNFRPRYYAFYDGEVLYDSQYARSSTSTAVVEPQQNIHKRIKEETSYIGSLVTFTELENSVPPSPLIETSLENLTAEILARAANPLDSIDGDEDTGEAGDIIEILTEAADLSPDGSTLRYFSIDLGEEPRQDIPTPDIYRFGQPIGNAQFDGPTQQSAPAWKIALLQGNISSSFPINQRYTEERIPQLNTKIVYKKRIESLADISPKTDPSTVSEVLSTTPAFYDDTVISLVKDDLLSYVEEVNTELLSENFDIQVYKVEVVPANKAIGMIFIDSENCPTSRELITIRDGITTQVFEFLDEGESVTEASYIGVDLYAGPGPSDSQCHTCTGNLRHEIEASDLNVTVDWSELSEFRRFDHNVITLFNHVEAQPWQWTNYEITETMVNGYAHGFESGSISLETLHPKKFVRTNPQVVDGMMMYGTAPDTHMFGNNDPLTLTTSSVEYYFDILTDGQIDQKQACRGAQLFNKDSYYIDLEFECENEESCAGDKKLFYDIYGAAIEDPEICED